MGVDLGALCVKHATKLSDLKGKVVAIDAYNTIYQFLSIIRQPDGTPLKDAEGRVTSHLSGILYRTANLVEAGVRPIYVFDGKPHQLKRETLDNRRAIKEKALVEWRDALEAGDLERAKSKAQQTSRLTGEMVEQSKGLLRALGIPYVDAPGEGEAQAVHMVKRGDAYACASQDFDAILFGSPILLRNLTISGKRKLPGRQAYVNVEPETIKFTETLDSLGLTHEQLVDLAILVGTDFDSGVKGIGPKKALKLISTHDNLEGVMDALSDNERYSGELANLKEYEEVRRIFLEPNVTDDYAVEWRAPKREEVLGIMCGEFSFSKERISKAIDRFLDFKKGMSQKNLFDF